jgi:hypothetical protein
LYTIVFLIRFMLSALAVSAASEVCKKNHFLLRKKVETRDSSFSKKPKAKIDFVESSLSLSRFAPHSLSLPFETHSSFLPRVSISASSHPREIS